MGHWGTIKISMTHWRLTSITIPPIMIMSTRTASVGVRARIRIDMCHGIMNGMGTSRDFEVDI